MSTVFQALRVMGFCGAMVYLASFPLVGWRFLLPGRFTFGVVCCIGLAVLGARAVTAVRLSSMRALIARFLVYMAVIIIIGVMLDTHMLGSKDYFIVGLPISVAITIAAAVSLLRHRPRNGMPWGAVAKIAAFWLVLLASYFALQLSSDRAEFLRFTRIQWLMLPFVTAAGLIVAALMSQADQQKKLTATS